MNQEHMKTTKWALVGLGFISDRHRQAVERTGGSVVLTCDNDLTKGADFLDWRAMIVDPRFKEVDCVAILTPNYLHSTIAAACMAAGKKVLCEKPLCIEEADLEFLKDCGTVLQLRHHPKVKDAAEKGVRHIKLDITMFRDKSYFAGWKGDFRRSGGLLFNLGIHYLDLITYLLGPVKRILSSKSDIVGYDDTWDEWFEAEIECEFGSADFFIELSENNTKRTASRKFEATYKDGTVEDIELSQKENLSYEDLHFEVYKAFLDGTGLTGKDAGQAIRLATELYKMNKGR